MKLERDQVAAYWEMITKTLIVDEFIEYDQTYLNNMLERFLKGILVCWIAVKGQEAKAVIMTGLEVDPGGVRSLLIHNLYGVTNISLADWKQGFEKLSLYAERQRCKFIVAYSDVQRLIKLAEAFGGETSSRVLRIPINKE